MTGIINDMIHDVKAVFGFAEPLRVTDSEKILIVEALTMYYDGITPSKDNNFHYELKSLIRKIKKDIEP